MPDRRTPTAAERSASLVRDAATVAVELALSGHKEATEAAVARAIRDERVDRDLKEHQRRLDSINGSQERMAKALGDLRDGQAMLVESSERHAAVAEALAEENKSQTQHRFSHRQLVVGWVGGAAAWAGLLLAVLLR